MMMISLLFFFAMVSCSCNYSYSDAKQFLFERTDPKIPQNAQTLCRNEYGTNLATLTSLDDHIKLENLHRGLSNNFCVIGLNDIANERFGNTTGWVFFSGTSQVIDLFGDAQPTSGAQDDCVCLNKFVTSTRFPGRIPWAICQCNARFAFACDDAVNPRYIAELEQKLTYSQAQAFCRANFNSDLATVRNQAEQNYLFRLIGVNSVWIGLNDIAQEGVFAWESGLAVDFSKFLLTEPNGGANENCVIALGSQSGNWSDIGCDVPQNFLCDKNFKALVGGIVGVDPFETSSPTTSAPTTSKPTTSAPTTSKPTTSAPTTSAPTTSAPTTSAPTTSKPTTSAPTTSAPTTSKPTTLAPTTGKPTTSKPTLLTPITNNPTVASPDDDDSNKQGVNPAFIAAGAGAAAVFVAAGVWFVKRRSINGNNYNSPSHYYHQTMQQPFRRLQNEDVYIQSNKMVLSSPGPGRGGRM